MLSELLPAAEAGTGRGVGYRPALGVIKILIGASNLAWPPDCGHLDVQTSLPESDPKET